MKVSFLKTEDTLYCYTQSLVKRYHICIVKNLSIMLWRSFSFEKLPYREKRDVTFRNFPPSIYKDINKMFIPVILRLSNLMGYYNMYK